MDNRFPPYLRFILKKLDFLGLANLGMLISGLAVLGFIGTNILGAPLERFIFSPELVRAGEWWRLFAYPLMTDPVWLFFFVMYSYFVLGSLEGHWGPGPTTIFTLLSYVSSILAGFVVDRSVQIWAHVMENISLAFGTLFPNLELYLFFILPVKAKWLAALAGAFLFYQFITGDGDTKIFLLIVLFPYFFFFGPYLYSEIRLRIKVIRNRRKFD